jgi:hypothetical protein
MWRDARGRGTSTSTARPTHGHGRCWGATRGRGRRRLDVVHRDEDTDTVGVLVTGPVHAHRHGRAHARWRRHGRRRARCAPLLYTTPLAHAPGGGQPTDHVQDQPRQRSVVAPTQGTRGRRVATGALPSWSRRRRSTGTDESMCPVVRSRNAQLCCRRSTVRRIAYLFWRDGVRAGWCAALAQTKMRLL